MDRQAVQRFIKSIWLFPTIVLIGLTVMTAFRISGTSIGIYSILDGTYAQDPGTIAGYPRGVRSDEWLVTSQMTVAQATSDFKKVNSNIANGQDMAFLDVPYKDWSSAFRPQNIAFFILPLEHAFAFKWWFLAAILVLACYFFLLELFPKKILLAVLLASFVGLSPMLFWWYSNSIFLPIAYTFFMALFFLRLCKTDDLRHRVFYTAVLAYILACFVLILYPPFQIPCLIVLASFLIGWIAEHYRTKARLGQVLQLWPYIIAAVIIPLLIVFAFYQSNKSAINAVTHTVYPGTRIIPSGDVAPLMSFSSFLAPNLQYDEKAASGYFNNQSEASNFILIAPFLLVPSLYLIIREWRQNRRIFWGLLFMSILVVFFLARIHIATPWLEPLHKLLLLDKVPGKRLLIGIGLAGVLQLALLIKALYSSKLSRREVWAMSIFGALSALITMLLIGHYTVQHFPVFIASYAKVAVFALWISFGILLVLQRRIVAGMALLVAFSALSVYRIHPLYQGLGPVTTAPVIKAIAAYPNKAEWIVVDDRLIINFPLMAGKKTLNAVHFYPQMDLWKTMDPKGIYENVYNRYAHVVFSTNPNMDKPFVLQHADMFLVKFEPCSSMMQAGTKYVLSTKELTGSCLGLRQMIDLPGKDYYIYQITALR